MPYESTGGVFDCLNQRRGVIIDQETIEGASLSLVKAHLPVSESFGFNKLLRECTSGKAFPQCSFSHWSLVNGDPLDVQSKAGTLVMQIRKRKGLKEEMPNLNNYLDHL